MLSNFSKVLIVHISFTTVTYNGGIGKSFCPGCTRAFFLFVSWKICQQVGYLQFEKLAKFLRSSIDAMSSEASKFWQNKQSCFFSNHSAVMLCKTRWFIISVWKNPWVRFPSLGRDDRIFLVHLTLFLSWETRHVSTVTIWKKQIASTWNSPSITSIKASTSSASVDQNALRSARKKNSVPA